MLQQPFINSVFEHNDHLIKSKIKFLIWLERLNYHFELADSKIKRPSLLCHLEVDAFEMAKNLGIKGDTVFTEACQRLKDHYALSETIKEKSESFLIGCRNKVSRLIVLQEMFECLLKQT